MLNINIGFIAIAAPAVLALTPLETFYPPNLNDTAYIADASLGKYGGIFQASTRESNSTAAFGTYDYCTMPHPRAQEYKLPEAISNGSLSGSIVFLEYMQRHQRRTPYNIFPGGEVCNGLYFVIFNPILVLEKCTV